VIAVITFGISWLSHSERFVINSIQVTGNNEISKQTVMEYVSKQVDDSTWHYISQKNIFFFDKDAIEKGLLSDMPRLRSVKVTRPSKFSQALVIAVDERRPAALWCSENSVCYRMDDSGFIFDEASTITVTSYTFDGGVASSSLPIGQIFADGHMQEILAALERLRKAGFSAGGASVDSDADYRAHLIKGYDIKIRFGSDANKLVRDLQLVLSSDALKNQESNLAYVDLRFGNRVYFKLKGENAAEKRGE
jgi:cell division septal protein FtsQ